MLRRIIAVATLLAVVIVIAGCSTHIHKVGAGAQGNAVIEERQWYALWGLVPINTVDTDAMAEGAADYEIKTETSALDVIINIFTTYVSVVSRTVTVTK
jgi:hypothetical protein